MTIKYAQIGAISSGTMRTEDLLATFGSELEYHVRRNKGKRGLGLPAKRKLIAEAARVDPESEVADEIVSELIDALENFAPPYAYFGTTEGDGASFGFWPCLDMHGDCDDLPRFEAGCAPDDFRGDCLLITDHGNVTCGCYGPRGRFTEYWSVV